MDLHSGTSYWLLLHGLRTVVPPLAGKLSCDVAVIGSGITGALLAWTLARDGLRVVVVDRRDLAQGSTAASTALLQYDLDVPLHKLERLIDPEHARRGFRVGLDAIDLLERIGNHIGSTVDRVPSLYYVGTDAKTRELESELHARARAGLDVAWLEARALRAEWNVNASAAIKSSDAAQLDPFDFTHRLLVAAIGMGAAVHDRTTVTRIETGNDRLTLHTDRNADIHAEYVVHATGYESANQLPRGLVELSSTYALVSEPTSPPRERCLLWEYADPYLYARWTSQRLLWGGEDIPYKNDRLRDAQIEYKTQVLLRKARDLLPHTPIEPAFVWAGTFGHTPDGLGYIGPAPERPRELFALGFGGNGITFSALASRILSNHIQARPDPDAELFAFERTIPAAR